LPLDDAEPVRIGFAIQAAAPLAASSRQPVPSSLDGVDLVSGYLMKHAADGLDRGLVAEAWHGVELTNRSARHNGASIRMQNLEVINVVPYHF